MRTIIWFIYFTLYLIVMLPRLVYIKHLVKIGKLEQAEAALNISALKWAHRLLKLAGVQIEVSGQENIPQGPVVFISNHQGNFDIPTLLTCLDTPHGFIAKVETLKIPVICDWMRLLHCIFLDRKDVRSAVSTMSDGVKIVKKGHSLIVFPEGTRSKGEQMGPFKLGAFTIASKAQVPVVPVRISGTYKAMEANNNKIKPATVRVKILPAIDTKDKSRAEIKELGDSIALLLQDAIVPTEE